MFWDFSIHKFCTTDWFDGADVSKYTGACVWLMSYQWDSEIAAKLKAKDIVAEKKVEKFCKNFFGGPHTFCKRKLGSLSHKNNCQNFFQKNDLWTKSK